MFNATNPRVTLLGLMTSKQYLIIMEYYAEAGTILSLVGIVSNIVNIRTFIAMSLSDGITVSFLSLAIFDLSYLIISLTMGFSVAFGIIELKSPTRYRIDPHSICIMLANVMVLVNIANVLTTTFLAIARCMCVAKPLHFKHTFNRVRTIGIISGFVVFTVAIYTPVIANMGITTQLDNKVNLTRPTLWMSANREYIKVIVWVVTGMTLPFSTQFVVFVCVLIMASSLRAASRFRQSSVLPTVTTHKKCSEITISDGQENKDCQNAPTGISDKLVGKDLRVVQQVVLISLVYVICNTPKILIGIVSSIETEFSIGKRFNNVYLSVNTLRQHFEIFNASINTVIYYKYNTKFRKTLLRL